MAARGGAARPGRRRRGGALHRRPGGRRARPLDDRAPRGPREPRPRGDATAGRRLEDRRASRPRRGGRRSSCGCWGCPCGSFPGAAEGLVARCSSDVARDADVVSVLDTRYLLDEGSPLAAAATRCFDAAGAGQHDRRAGAGRGPRQRSSRAAVHSRAGPRPSSWASGRPGRTTLVAQDSNAGVALRSLGGDATPPLVPAGRGRPHRPRPTGRRRGPSRSGRAWTGPAVALVGLAVVLLALARGRRLGRLVREPLPVVVRAIETTESRGRLYRRAGDRGRAAQVLRAGTAARLSRRLAVPPGAAAASLVQAVSTTAGRRARRGRCHPVRADPGRRRLPHPPGPAAHRPRGENPPPMTDHASTPPATAAPEWPAPRRRRSPGAPARRCSRSGPRWPRPSSARMPRSPGCSSPSSAGVTSSSRGCRASRRPSSSAASPPP